MTTKAHRRRARWPFAVSVLLRGTFDQDLAAFTDRRVRYAFARFGSSVRRVRVELTQDHDGETSCRLQLHGAARRPVVVVESGLGAPAALRAAMNEAARQVARDLRRGWALVHRDPGR